MEKGKFNILKRKSVITAFLLIIAVAIVFVNTTYVSAKKLSSEKQIENVNKKQLTDAQKLALIDKYQKKYFTIVKRNNFLLRIEDSALTDKDRKELKKLFAEVESQITDKKDLKKYKKIEKKYSVCKEETTVGMNEFADNNYKEVDDLLNAVYNKVQKNISPEDFKQLTESEIKWVKEVEDYEKVYNSMKFGTIGTIIYYGYEINMRKFRTLLLMLYL